ncbi:MAG: orotate phosphoribosyltransferase [Tissierellales bacterium]|jgi:orotate phosphoribosyltransferase|nr:orotate phosphoribosyltransferase [Tissierellales bacterium]
MERYKQEFIEFMVECGVLTFGDFTTKSGRKTPFFINTGNYKNGRQLQKLGDFYAKAIKERFNDDFDILFGPAYKGIPLSVATTISLNSLYDMEIGYCSNRKEVKDHGDKGILLGHKIEDGSRIVIIEDVTTAGTSIYETMPILESQGKVDVKGLMISVDRMERGQGEKSALVELKEKFDMETYAIVSMDEVIEYLYGREVQGKVLIDDEMKSAIEKYYELWGAK